MRDLWRVIHTVGVMPLVGVYVLGGAVVLSFGLPVAFLWQRGRGVDRWMAFIADVVTDGIRNLMNDRS